MQVPVLRVSKTVARLIFDTKKLEPDICSSYPEGPGFKAHA